MSEASTVKNNETLRHYEIEADGSTAFAAYEEREGAISFTHTEVPPAVEGRGIGKALIRGALADVRSRGLKVIAICEFVAAYIDRHPEEQDLLATGAPG